MFNEFNSWLFYLGVFGGSAYLLGFIRENQKKRTFFALTITLVALAMPILIAAYRVCGTDTFLYMRTYVTTRRTPWVQLIDDMEGLSEIGHTFLTKFLGYFKSIRIYLGAYAAIMVVAFYFATKKVKNEALTFAMILFYFGVFSSSFNIMRQCVAVALVAHAYTFVFEKNFLKFFSIVFLASCFHLSAFITVFVYFLWTKEEKLIPTLFLGIILVVVALVAFNIDSILTSFTGEEFKSATLQRYTGYGGDVDVEFKNRDFYLSLVIAVIIVTHHSRLVKIDGKNVLYIFLFYISIALGLCGFINPYAKRIAMYFEITSIWVIADIPKCYKDHTSVWSARLLIIFYAILKFTITAYVLEQGALIPYVWVLPSWARF